MNFLTVEQALGDIVEFIDTIRRTTRYPRVILFGSGYGATLAAWTRKKYPHLVDGIWSSSGIFFLEDYAESISFNLLFFKLRANWCNTYF